MIPLSPCQTRIADLRVREVINLCDGARLGFPCDLLFDINTGKITALLLPGKPRGLIRREEDIVIPWNDIIRIGEDIILVEIKVC